jgi:hypothetical protein
VVTRLGPDRLLIPKRCSSTAERTEHAEELHQWLSLQLCDLGSETIRLIDLFRATTESVRDIAS